MTGVAKPRRPGGTRLSDGARHVLYETILTYHDTETVKEIAARAGVGLSTVFSHMGDLRRAGQLPPAKPKRPAAARFWKKVDKSGDCWIWTAGVTTTGYGGFNDGTRTVKAHRFAYELLIEKLPADTLLDHACHNPLCVRPGPDHVRPATNKQNMENLSGPKGASGVRGVSWNKASQRWHATVKHHGRGIHVGSFIDLAEAEHAVVAKRNELFTHNMADRR